VNVAVEFGSSETTTGLVTVIEFGVGDKARHDREKL
jgi:hypothetical protein